ncbi:MAG: hypothetical protein EVJ47_07420 [Candidatus Acidulodesulfobacterium ferriphilum]|uniref:Glycosyltransferase family 9 protein n=1 Tax=Candidatus Acidulodesulfobacterium ferriphilum TaxID=2597223 RepID=A0A519BA08_9DELT|nr:MAG: hypothetical protein EVJ47_07420 [Candidatus Acidulodesulfobacterium ferriphilum]
MSARENKKKIIIFQTRRIGDLFQTLPLINNILKKHNNECNILVVVDDDFVNLQSNFKSNIELIGKKEFYKHYYLNIANNNKLKLNPNEIELFKLNFKNYYWNNSNNIAIDSSINYDFIYFDEAINLTFDITNSLILNIIDSKVKFGFIGCGKSEKKNEIICRGKAANYFYNTIKYREQNRINIVDVFSLIGAGRYFLNSKYNFKFKKIKDKIRIFFVVASSNSKRDWPVEEFTKLAESIIKNFDCEIILLGTQKEIETASEIKNGLNHLNHSVIDLTGRTTLNKLIDLLKTGDILISPDTGLLQIACNIGLDSVSIFLGNANVYETGPYLKNAYVISPILSCYPCREPEKCENNFKCKDNIKADDVFKVLELKLLGKKYTKKTLLNNLKQTLQEKRFNVYKCDTSVSVAYYNIFKQNITKQELIAEIFKYAWINLFAFDEQNKIKKENVIKIINKKYLFNSKIFNDKNNIIIENLNSELKYLIEIFKNACSINNIKEKSRKKYELLNFKNNIVNLKINYPDYSLIFDYFTDEINYKLINNSINFKDIFNEIIYLVEFSSGILDNLKIKLK